MNALYVTHKWTIYTIAMLGYLLEGMYDDPSSLYCGIISA